MKKLITMCIVFTMLLCMVTTVSASNSFLVDESFTSYNGGNSISGWTVTASSSNLTAFDGPSGKAVRYSTASTGEIMTKTFTTQTSGQILVTADVCVDTNSSVVVYLANANSSQRSSVTIKNAQKPGEWSKLNVLLDIESNILQGWFDNEYEKASVSDFDIDSCSKLFFACWDPADSNGYVIIDNVKVIKLPQTFSVNTDAVHSSVYDVFDLGEEKAYSFMYKNSDSETRDITVECIAKNTNGDIITQKVFKQSVASQKSYSDKFVFNLNQRKEGTVSVALSDSKSDIIIYRQYKFICMNTSADDKVFSLTGGVNAHMGQGKSVTANAPLAMSMGVSVVRDGVDWWRIEKTKGVYEFPAFADQMVNALNDNGTELLFILSYGNTLYSSNEKDIPKTKDYINAWLGYVNAVVSRYKDNVDYWQVWNEPNIETFNTNGATPQEYTELLKQTYTLIKQIDPTSKVVGGGLAGLGNTWSTDGRPYLRKMLAAGAGAYMDVLDVHPYKQDASPEEYMAERLPLVQSDLKNYNCGDIEIWIGELGWYAGTANTAVTEEKQAAYSIRSRVLYDGFNYEENKNGKFFWYDFQNDGTTQDYSEHNYGMTLNNFTPKPAYYAYSAFNYIVGNKALKSLTAESSGIYKANYEDDTYIYWKKSGSSSKELSFNGANAKIYNMYGDLIETVNQKDGVINYNAQITENPIFICVEKKASSIEKEISVNSVITEGNTISVSANTYPNADVSISLWAENAEVENLTALNAFDYISGIKEVKSDFNGAFDFEMSVNVKEARNYTLIISVKGCQQYRRIVTIGNESVALLKATKNGVELKSLKDVKKGDVVKIEGSYFGDLPGALLIGKIETGGGNFMLQSVGYLNGSTAENVEFTVDEDGIDAIDIFLWNGFDTMTPIVEKQTIK